MSMAKTQNQRLKEARIKAGYKSASSAIDACGWAMSTYRAHENGQNGFKIDDAKNYGEAYGVSPAWLLFGEIDKAAENKIKKPIKKHNHNCAEHIFAAAMLLKDDPTNNGVIEIIEECLNALKAKK